MIEKNIVAEFRWRGMIHDIMPGTEEFLQKEITTAYVGIDPTADSLHVGHLVSIMMLKHLQLAGHKPIALIGGATGMIGDPSGRSEERVLLDEEVLRHNQARIEEQVRQFLDFSPSRENRAEIVNNYDWMKDFGFLGFLRDVGKHLTVNYMMAKDSVKKRLETGLSFTEFSYQLLQAYDFFYLYQHKNCRLQMGGSDQWGNITAGTELIRRKGGDEAYALTCPLITKADGGKFGKTEEGNVWLAPRYTTPYQFYQFWINTSDADAEKYIKIFTLLPKEEIDSLVARHRDAPHERLLQRTLAREVTVMVHAEDDFKTALDASEILFGQGTTGTLKKLSTPDLLAIFSGVPMPKVSRAELAQGIDVVELVSVKTGIFPSKGEARRTIQAAGLSINKARVSGPEETISVAHLLEDKFILVQKGKKNYFLLCVE